MTTNKQIYWLGILLAIVVNIFSWHLPFFWDTILTSTVTQYFFDYGFHNIIIPAEFDAGHPPLFYIYVSSFYYVFGKNLFAAHFSMLPFTILGIVSFIHLMLHFSFNKSQQFLGIILFFAMPAVITQNILVSYDAVLLSLYLTAFVAYFKNYKILFSFILIVIVGITLRGLFCVASLSITIYFLESRNRKSWLKWNLLFFPAIAIVGSWYLYHYTQSGWLFTTKSEGWNEHRSFVDILGMFKNGISIARCFFDLGVFILSILCLLYFEKIRKVDKYTLLWIIPALVFSISFLPFTNPINHRYYLIIYVLMLLPVIQFLSDRKRIYTFFTLLILLLGNIQIYPVPISNAWDCTLAYTSYHKCLADFKDIGEKVLFDETKKTGTVFPMNASLKQTNMIEDNTRMTNVNGITIDSFPYILFSNIGNDFSDAQIIQLRSWIQFYRVKHGLVELILYQNPAFNSK